MRNITKAQLVHQSKACIINTMVLLNKIKDSYAMTKAMLAGKDKKLL